MNGRVTVSSKCREDPFRFVNYAAAVDNRGRYHNNHTATASGTAPALDMFEVFSQTEPPILGAAIFGVA